MNTADWTMLTNTVSQLRDKLNEVSILREDEDERLVESLNKQAHEEALELVDILENLLTTVRDGQNCKPV